MTSVNVLGVNVCAVRPEDLYREIGRCVRGDQKKVFAYANVHAINIARHDELFRTFLNQAAIVYADGEGIRLGARILGGKLPARIALTHWVWSLCEWCEGNEFSVYLLGARDETVRRAVAVLQSRYSGLRVAGWHNGYFEAGGWENELVLDEVNVAKPDILFVGFGMPLQEHWIMQNIDALRAHAILPCGSMIDYVAGIRSVSPRWMSKGGLEWLYRLVQEPGRLWRRYLLGNPLFLWRVFCQRINQEESAWREN